MLPLATQHLIPLKLCRKQSILTLGSFCLPCIKRDTGIKQKKSYFLTLVDWLVLEAADARRERRAGVTGSISDTDTGDPC